MAKKKEKKPLKMAGPWANKIKNNRNKSGKWLKAVEEGKREAKLNPSSMSLIRIRKNLYQHDICKALGISESTFSQIERGHRPVKGDEANKIAGHLGVSLTKIFKPHPKYKRKFAAVIQSQQI